MALKTLQKKYDELLKVFGEVGVTLTESQKDSLDTFMIDFQNKLNETRDNAIKVTKKLVEEKMEKEYRQVFESILSHQKEVLEKAGRIDVLRSQKVMTEAVDQYLTECVKEVLPKKTLVDYKRLQKLEQVHESLKDMLVVSESDVERKVSEAKSEAEAKSVSESKKLKSELEQSKEKLAETSKMLEESRKQCDELAKRELIREKTKNLPIVESRKAQERLSKMTVEEIQKDFKTVLESVQQEVQEEQDKIQEEKNLEEAIADILEGDAPKKTGDEEDKGQETSPEEGGDEKAEPEEKKSEEDEDSAVQVTESMMQSWIETLARITPKR